MVGLDWQEGRWLHQPMLVFSPAVLGTKLVVAMGTVALEVALQYAEQSAEVTVAAVLALNAEQDDDAWMSLLRSAETVVCIEDDTGGALYSHICVILTRQAPIRQRDRQALEFTAPRVRSLRVAGAGPSFRCFSAALVGHNLMTTSAQAPGMRAYLSRGRNY